MTAEGNKIIFFEVWSSNPACVCNQSFALGSQFLYQMLYFVEPVSARSSCNPSPVPAQTYDALEGQFTPQPGQPQSRLTSTTATTAAAPNLTSSPLSNAQVPPAAHFLNSVGPPLFAPPVSSFQAPPPLQTRPPMPTFQRPPPPSMQPPPPGPPNAMPYQEPPPPYSFSTPASGSTAPNFTSSSSYSSVVSTSQ